MGVEPFNMGIAVPEVVSERVRDRGLPAERTASKLLADPEVTDRGRGRECRDAKCVLDRTI